MTNLKTQDESEPIAAHRLLAALEYLDSNKSSTNDLSHHLLELKTSPTVLGSRES